MSEEAGDSFTCSESPEKLVITDNSTLHDDGEVVEVLSRLITTVCRTDSLRRDFEKEREDNERERDRRVRVDLYSSNKNETCTRCVLF